MQRNDFRIRPLCKWQMRLSVLVQIDLLSKSLYSMKKQLIYQPVAYSVTMLTPPNGVRKRCCVIFRMT